MFDIFISVFYPFHRISYLDIHHFKLRNLDQNLTKHNYSTKNWHIFICKCINGTSTGRKSITIWFIKWNRHKFKSNSRSGDSLYLFVFGFLVAWTLMLWRLFQLVWVRCHSVHYFWHERTPVTRVEPPMFHKLRGYLPPMKESSP